MKRTRALVLLATALDGCNSDDGGGRSLPANLTVRQRIADLAPVAVFAHRGLGPTRAGMTISAAWYSQVFHRSSPSFGGCHGLVDGN